MKKKSGICLLMVSVFLLLTGCQTQPQYSSENAYVAGQDFQYQFYKAAGINLTPLSITETEEGYYFLTQESFLYYADKESMEAVLLCSRPDCLHDQEPKEMKRRECNAYFPGSGTLFFSDGSLYIPCEKATDNISDPTRPRGQVYKVSADGTTRESLFDLYSETCFRFHRGMLYYLDSPPRDAEGTGNKALYRRALTKDSEPEMLTRFQVTQVPEITLYGDNVYVSLDNSFLQMNLTTKKETIIGKPSSDGYSALIGFRQNKLVYKVLDNDKIQYYLSELDGSNPKVLSALEDCGFVQVDDQYFYDVDVDFWSENAKPAEKRSVRVLQEDGTLVSEFPIGEDGLLLAMAADPYIFTAKTNEDDNWQVCYAKKSDVETGQVQWKTVILEDAVQSDGVMYTG